MFRRWDGERHRGLRGGRVNPVADRTDTRTAAGWRGQHERQQSQQQDRLGAGGPVTSPRWPRSGLTGAHSDRTVSASEQRGCVAYYSSP